jgi:high-affinity iron transporter
LSTIMSRLATETDALAAAVQSGNLAEARTLWLPAHLDYERLGAVYDTFGNFNTEINGTPLGLVGGVNNTSWSGFYRLEYGLWNSQSVSELTPVATTLDRDVHALLKAFPSLSTGANDVQLRTHEILENTLQFQLTDELDFGSHTTLATAWANVQGTQLSLAAITPLLRPEDPSLLASVQTGLQNMAAAFHAYDVNGTWAPLESLSQTQAAQLDGELGALLQQLDQVPDLLDLPFVPAQASDS